MGCVALLIAAFGMNDSMDELKHWEYDDISHFESKLLLSNDANQMELYYILNDTNGSFIMQQSIEIKANDLEDTVLLLVSNNTDLISYTDSNKNPIELDEGESHPRIEVVASPVVVVELETLYVTPQDVVFIIAVKFAV